MSQVRRLLLLTIGLAPMVLVGVIAAFWIESNVPEWVYWKVGLIFVLGFEAAYAATIALAVPGAIGLGCRLVLGKARQWGQSAARRGLLLCVALLCALATAEAVCAVWERRAHRATAVPVGGLKGDAPPKPFSRFAGPVARFDLPTKFLDSPGDSDIDLVVLGESSAAGVPFQRWISIAKIVAWQLNEVFPARTIRLTNLARAGDTLERQHQALANLGRRPELVIVYCGHNEFYSRLWWSANLDHYVVDRERAAWQLAVARVERLSPLCRLVQETADKCRIAIPPPVDVKRDLVDAPVYTAAEYEALAQDFRRRLDEMVSYIESVGALAVLILPPANDAGFEPNRSFLPPTTPRAERDSFRRAFLEARRLEDRDPGESIKRYRALLARQPCFAETHYRLARILEQSGDWDEAYGHYVLARDLDGFPMRCLTAFQEAYRETAARHGCILVDGQAYFHAIGRRGQLDDQLFQDAMHPSLRGQIALAQGTLHALYARRAFGWPDDAAPAVIDPARCARHFGIDDAAWSTLCYWAEWFNNEVARSRYDSSGRLQAREAGLAAAKQIAAGVAPEAVGLPNIGTPPAVPVEALADIDLRSAAAPRPAVLPCLGASAEP
jgi:hypothetical protein